MDDSTFLRFAAKVALPDPVTQCMNWAASTDSKGYGQLWLGGRGGRPRKAHRLSYEHFVGPIPTGLVVDHLCRNRRCVRPDHLEVKTSRENTFAPGSLSRAVANAARTQCPRGHSLVGANLRPYSLARGERQCLACFRAYPVRSQAERNQGVIWTEAEFRAHADLKYAEIMSPTEAPDGD